MADALIKLVVVCFDARDDPAARRAVLLEQVAPALLDGPARWLSVLVADEEAVKTPSPTPFPLGGRRPVGLVNAWVASVDDAEAVRRIVAEAGFDAFVWESDESIYKDYGDNAHAGPRDWPDGQRSPGVTAVTFMERPARLTREAWLRRWHGTMSPVSEGIQPRTRYVRNVLGPALTEGAPAWEGLVEEAWPSGRHVTDPFLFYGARGPLALVRNMGTILWTVTRFLTLWRITTVMMSEWFVRTPGGRRIGG